MKLIVAIIDDEFSGKVVKALMAEKIRATKLSSTGGFLSSGNTTLLIGVEDDRVDEITELINKHCKSKRIKNGTEEVTVGVNLFVMPVSGYERI
ncbi:cyclic-di-AMP receptor [Gudongella oleilytica]|jgi:uncharacterized protein YaaQ|uniref:cyclic-di-AMP receptor n=1 Tax=Gudongella oleilytica TaxID=1582259 RepID=UPI002A3591F7|nr:cyclic-di-AMP receptor [Gudongella oleilytica]MDY0255928.1 cyclic-di-AMP receptor [Gudongella oleilytica]